MIKVRASISIRLPSGKFPRASYTRVLQPAVQQVMRDFREGFQAEKDPRTGKPWPPRKLEYPHPMIRKSRLLFRSAIRAVEQAVITNSTLSIRIPDSPVYLKYQFFGTKKIAARRFIGVSRRTRQWVARRLKGEGVRVWRSQG